MALKLNTKTSNFFSCIKKSTVFLSLALTLVSCNNNSLSDQNLQNEQISTYSSDVSIEGDETDIKSDEPVVNPEPANLPQLPNIPVYGLFNNDYKGLYADNEVIAHADPKNPDKYFISLLNSAKTSIDAAIFDLDDVGASNAFINAQKRGVKVRIVTDGDNLKDKVDVSMPRISIENLKANGIPVHDDGNRRGFMHHKFIVVDNKIVWTGSYNLTTNAMYRDNNNVVMINSPELAANYNAEFKRLFEQGLFNPNPHEIPNPVVTMPDYTIKTYFSPGGSTKTAIMDAIKNAQKSIKFMAFSFTDMDMANVFIEKSKLPGFSVEGVLDRCQVSKYSVYRTLLDNKIYVKTDGNQALMHHKIMIIDDKIVITGSFNFSKNAEAINNENTIIVNSPILAKIYNNEYSRIKYAAIHNTNLPPYNHPACNH